jgi:microcystin-dependent protein
MSVPDPANTAWVPLWDTGAVGASFGSIPGEIKMWGGKVLPDPLKYGKWVWCDGAIYDAVTYPEASTNIAVEWKTAHGLADPGAGKFRAPDMRGVAPMGLDAMPGGARANRTVRAVAIVVAGRGGEELHTMTLAEMPAHGHVVNSHSHGGSTGYISVDHSHAIGDPGHAHTVSMSAGVATGGPAYAPLQNVNYANYNFIQNSGTGIYTGGVSANHYHAVNAEAPGTNNAGSGGAHENLPPAIFVPWIVRLDG